MKHGIILVFLSLSLIFSVTCRLSAQNKRDTLTYNLNVRSVLGSGDMAPFLSSANQFDRHSLTPNHVSVWGTLHKPMDHAERFDYGFGAELDANLSVDEQRLFPGELYAEGKAWFLVVTAGMKRAVYGNNDPVLSSGGMLWSRNSRPMPRLSIESDDYLKVPFTMGFLEVKGGLTHGWFEENTVTTNTLLHYKYAGVRVGGSLPVHVNYSLHHVAQWAGTSPTYGYSPATLDNYLRVFLGRSGDDSAPATERINTLGNHIISKNIGLEIDFNKARLELYWQNIYEDPPILPGYKTFNIEDGLWGFSLQLPAFKPLYRLVGEVFFTTDMSGPWHDLDGVIYGGQDGYYTNGVYLNGWSFYGMTIGNPWITSPKYNPDYETGGVGIQNNRIRLFYLAGMGKFNQVSYQTVFAFSKNYKPTGASFVSKDQFSWLLEAQAPIPFLKKTSFSAGFSGDRGAFYGNNYAVLLGLQWNGLLSW